MKMRKPSRPDLHDWDARATEALDAARLLPVGAARNEALKKAGVLRNAADARGVFAPKPVPPVKA
jgi:hypothetical protein